MPKDWFRNTDWDEHIEKHFEEKLRRARPYKQSQYLRIQACTLAKSHPLIALKLLERYFDLPDEIFYAQAHVDRATALQQLGRIDDSIAAYEAALAREEEYPKYKTQALLELPYQIASQKLRPYYPRALELLKSSEKRLLFPVDFFRWHASWALIIAENNEIEEAKSHAEKAIQAAKSEHSGFRYHPDIGLVAQDHNQILHQLQKICQSSRWD